MCGDAITQTDQRDGSTAVTPSRDILLSQQKTCHFPRHAAPSRTNAIRFTGTVAFPNICQMLRYLNTLPQEPFQYFIAGFMTCPVQLARELGMNWNWAYKEWDEQWDCGLAASNLIVGADRRVGREMCLHSVWSYVLVGTAQIPLHYCLTTFPHSPHYKRGTRWRSGCGTALQVGRSRDPFPML
jgi:hypothetical protein